MAENKEQTNCEYDLRYYRFYSIQQAEHLHYYIEARNKGGEEFYHYTSLATINRILETGKLRFSCVSMFNDENDKQQFTDQQCYYAICFATGQNENLPLWYLYSGVNGKGGRITFKHKHIDLLETSQLELCEYDYYKNEQIGDPILLTDKDITFMKSRVIYAKEAKNGKFCDLKYSNLTNYNKFTVEEKNKYKDAHIGFVKQIVWAYEKEFRVLIKVDKKLIEEGKQYAIFAKLDDEIIKHIKIRLAPEVINETENLSKYDAIERFIVKTSNFEKSEYAGLMKMRICDKCQSNPNQNVKTMGCNK